MAGFFSNMFGAGTGGISHGGNGNVQALPVAQPQQQLSTGSGAGTTPPNPVGNQQEQKPDVNSPDYLLEEMGKVWQTPVDAEGKPLAPKADPLNQQLFQFKPEDVKAAAEKLDFTAGINPELAGKALGGDAASLVELINGAVRQAFVATTLNTGNLLNDGFGRHSKNIDQALPDRIKNYQVADMKSEDPILSHPSVSPMIEGMKAMLRSKNPNMSPREIQSMAEGYARNFAKTLSSSEIQQVEQKKTESTTDWLDYAGIGKTQQ